MEELTIHLLSQQADSPDAKDELACLETEHQKTLGEVSREVVVDQDQSRCDRMYKVFWDIFAYFIRSNIQ